MLVSPGQVLEQRIRSGIRGVSQEENGHLLSRLQAGTGMQTAPQSEDAHD